MNPIYKFELSDGVNTQQAFPVYKDDLSLEYALESGEQFYRAKLNGELIFQEDDYSLIVNASFDTQFTFIVYVSYSGGSSWNHYWAGQFWKTDCKFDGDDRTVTVKPEVKDQYNAVLAGLEKEFDLIQLAPVINQVKADKRPMVQIYVAGSDVIGCFLSGMWWEQSCQEEDDDNKLRNTYHFANIKTQRTAEVTSLDGSELPAFIGDPFSTTSVGTHSLLSSDGEYSLIWRVFDSGGTRMTNVSILEVATSIVIASNQWIGTISVPNSVVLAGVGTIGNITLFIHDVKVYARYITDVESAGGTNTYPIPTDDIVENNRNYSRVLPYNFPNNIYFSGKLTSTPTKWGLYQPGEYYADLGAPSLGIPDAFPVARNMWTRISIWFARPYSDYIMEEDWRKEFTIKNAYPIWSAISVLLGQIAPGITHAESTDYSQFLYANNNPITGIFQRLLITPKSNIIVSGYDQPAQKAPVTLKQILDMLKNCFRCYWFIDDQNRFRIEHIQYFRKGGRYVGDPEDRIDLTQEVVSRNGKPWSYARNQYQFEKPNMPAWYQFEWMDSVTELFKGYPIEIVSKYVEQENIENITVGNFTSDIDYILLNPNEISMDGFVLLAPIRDSNSEFRLPYVDYTIDGIDYTLQNGYVCFHYLQTYYMFDLPAWSVRIHGESAWVRGVKKLKKQEIRFPVLQDPDPIILVKTSLGDGTIQKISINLQSRNANAVLVYEYGS